MATSASVLIDRLLTFGRVRQTGGATVAVKVIGTSAAVAARAHGERTRTGSPKRTAKRRVKRRTRRRCRARFMSISQVWRGPTTAEEGSGVGRVALLTMRIQR